MTLVALDQVERAFILHVDHLDARKPRRRHGQAGQGPGRDMAHDLHRAGADPRRVLDDLRRFLEFGQQNGRRPGQGHFSDLARGPVVDHAGSAGHGPDQTKQVGASRCGHRRLVTRGDAADFDPGPAQHAVVLILL